jgi:hypothetical protein
MLDQSFETSAQGYSFTFQKALEGTMDSDTDNALMDLDEVKENGQNEELSDDSDTSSVLSYTSQSHPSTPMAVSPMLSSSSLEANIITASSPIGEKEKPTKKIVMSAIRNAIKVSAEAKKLGKTQTGLLKFFSKGTEDDNMAYFRREDDKAAAMTSQDEAYRKHHEMKKKLRERELARERQQKRRKKLKDEDILRGARSPGGTKRKVR